MGVDRCFYSVGVGDLVGVEQDSSSSGGLGPMNAKGAGIISEGLSGLLDEFGQNSTLQEVLVVDAVIRTVSEDVLPGTMPMEIQEKERLQLRS